MMKKFKQMHCLPRVEMVMFGQMWARATEFVACLVIGVTLK
jgi:hypothetical protein